MTNFKNGKTVFRFSGATEYNESDKIWQISVDHSSLPNLAWIGLGVWVQEFQECPTSVIFVWLCVFIHNCIRRLRCNLAWYTMDPHLRAKLAHIGDGGGYRTVAHPSALFFTLSSYFPYLPFHVLFHPSLPLPFTPLPLSHCSFRTEQSGACKCVMSVLWRLRSLLRFSSLQRMATAFRLLRGAILRLFAPQGRRGDTLHRLG